MIPIRGFGTVNVKFQLPNGEKYNYRLLKCAYVPDFHTNVVSYQKLHDKGIRWDTDIPALTWKNKAGKVHIIGLTVRKYGQWVLEFNQVNSESQIANQHAAFAARNSRAPLPNLKGNYHIWHQRFGHANPTAISHLQDELSGIEVEPTQLDPNCEECRLTNSKQLISRRQRTRSTKPYELLHFDLIEIKRVFGDQQWILHFLEDKYGIHHVYHLTDRTQDSIVGTIRHLLNYVWRKWKLVVKQFMVDGETSLGDEWLNLLEEEGIEMIQSPPHTHDIHGTAERAGGVLTNRATALKLESNLPDNVYVECYFTAGYLLNRTPAQRLNWKTPIGGLQEEMGLPDWKPFAGNIYRFGSKAYVHNKTREKLEKLAPKAYVGWLVGYQGSNIWRIWIPTLSRVISTRDVKFDETKRYSKSDEEEESEITELVSLIELPTYGQIEEEDYTLEDYEVTIDEPGDTIIVGDSNSASTSKDTPLQPENQRYRPIPTVPTQQITPEMTPEREIQEMPHIPTIEDDSAAPESTDQSEGQNQALSEQSEALIGSDLVSTTTGNDKNQGNYENDENQLETVPDLVPPVQQLTDSDDQESDESKSTRSTKSTRKASTSKAKATEDPDAKPTNSTLISEANVLPIGTKRSRGGRREAAFLAAIDNQVDNPESVSPFMESFYAYMSETKLHQSTLPAAPNHYKDMLKHYYRPEWEKAIEEELKTLEDKGTWEELDAKNSQELNGVRPIPTRWVFAYKTNDDGYLTGFKARLVVRGDLQTSIFEDTYAATLAARVFRALMAITAFFDLDMWQYDAINAFTNSDIDEEVILYQPEGSKSKKKYLRLKKALYGLVRSPKLWFEDLSRTLVSMGFKSIPEAPCLFTNGRILIFFYVDDIAVLNRTEDIEHANEVRKALNEKYQLRDLGELQWFLKIRVIRDRKARKIWLCQDTYIKKMVNKYNLGERIHAPTPMGTEKLTPNNGPKALPQEVVLYQQKVGSVIYPTSVTRPDVAFAASQLASHLTNPSKEHQMAADRVMRYLNGTSTYALEYGNIPEATVSVFEGSSDASFADNEETRRSSEGRHFELFGGSIDWKASKQTTVSRSTTESELKAASNAGVDLQWWKRFFNSLDLDIDHTPFLNIDNLQTVRILTKEAPKLQTKLKHIDIHQHWLRQEVEEQRIAVKWVPTLEMKADGFTKALPEQKHIQFLEQIKLVDISHLLKTSDEAQRSDEVDSSRLLPTI